MSRPPTVLRSITFTFTYDPTGLRRTKTAPDGTVTRFTWDRSGPLPLLVAETTGASTTSYLYGPGGLAYAQVRDGVVEYLHHDQLGSTRVITNAAGVTIGSLSFDPYGIPTGTTGTATTRLGYAGQYTDAETGYQYLRARFYDPVTAQFLTRDPAVSLTREPYGYTGGDPLNRIDPSGLWSQPLPGDFCIGPDCVDTIVQQNPELGQGIVDFSGGVLEVNPITALTNALGLSETSRYSTDSSWVGAGRMSMAAFNAVFFVRNPATAGAMSGYGPPRIFLTGAREGLSSNACGGAAFAWTVGLGAFLAPMFGLPFIRTFYVAGSALLEGRLSGDDC